MTVKDIRNQDQQRVRDLRDKGYTIEIIWEKDWQALVTQQPEIKAYLKQCHIYTHFKKYLNQSQIIQYIQMDIYLALLNVILRFQTILKITFPKWLRYLRIQRFLLKMLVNICKTTPKNTTLRIFLVDY